MQIGNIEIDRKQNSQIGNINLDREKKSQIGNMIMGLKTKTELETMNLQIANNIRRLETVNQEIENTNT